MFKATATSLYVKAVTVTASLAALTALQPSAEGSADLARRPPHTLRQRAAHQPPASRGGGVSDCGPRARRDR